jgi:hypothetical protein
MNIMVKPPHQRIDIEAALNRFYSTSVLHYGDGAYAAGAFFITLAEIAANLPRHEQDKILDKFANLEKKLMK